MTLKSRNKGVFEGTHVDPVETLQTFFPQCQECQELLDAWLLNLVIFLDHLRKCTRFRNGGKSHQQE